MGNLSTARDVTRRELNRGDILLRTETVEISSLKGGKDIRTTKIETVTIISSV